MVCLEDLPTPQGAKAMAEVLSPCCLVPDGTQQRAKAPSGKASTFGAEGTAHRFDQSC